MPRVCLSPAFRCLYNGRMVHRCLAEFVEELGHAGDLARVAVDDDPALELPEISCRIARSRGPALLCGSDSTMPLAKTLVLVDGHVDMYDRQGVLAAWSVNIDPGCEYGWGGAT